VGGDRGGQERGVDNYLRKKVLQSSALGRNRSDADNLAARGRRGGHLGKGLKLGMGRVENIFLKKKHWVGGII